METEETFDDVLKEFIDHKKIHLEGRRGLEGLCKLAAALGYKDELYFGQIDRDIVIGDFLEMLQDNPGMMEAIVDKVREYGNDEWKENLLGHLPEKEEVTMDSEDMPDGITDPDDWNKDQS